jgi:hypothetical protein
MSGPCVVCGKPNAPFGYLPPLVEREAWFCFEHWPNRPPDWTPPPLRHAPRLGSATPGQCIVCDGKDPDCWCCTKRLPGPPEQGWPGDANPDVCGHCGGGERPDDSLLPFGVESVGHIWLHRGCWPAWRTARQANSAPEDRPAAVARARS